MNGIVLLGSEMGKLASLTVQPALRQRLQNAHQTPGSHPLLHWLMDALHAVWPNPGDLKEEKAIKEKDKLLREAELEVTRECQL